MGRLAAWDVVADARVLDLYCGSGALGLEALSRGAATATGIDSDRAAVRVAADNARVLGLDLVVVHDRVERWLRGPTSGQFELVLLDPPYDLPDIELTEVLQAVVDLAVTDAVVVVERARRSPEPVWPAGLASLEPRTYGDTTVWFAEATTPSTGG